ncbi:MAG: hypothetical protein M1823_006359, partial [Watsoniomyces obsoletus]
PPRHPSPELLFRSENWLSFSKRPKKERSNHPGNVLTSRMEGCCGWSEHSSCSRKKKPRKDKNKSVGTSERVAEELDGGVKEDPRYRPVRWLRGPSSPSLHHLKPCVLYWIFL